MTEKLFTGTLNHNQNKTKQKHYRDTLKEVVHELLQEFSFNSKTFDRSFGDKTIHFDVIVIRKMSFQTLTQNF